MASQGPWGGGSGDDKDREAGNAGNGQGNGGGDRDRPRHTPPRPVSQPSPPTQQPPAQPPRPWGQPVQPNGAPRPGPGRPGAPRGNEIDNLVRKGQDRLRVLMGGRGPNGGPGNGQNGGPRRPGLSGRSINRSTWGIFGLGAAALWVLGSFYTVNTEERSVELLFGSPYQVGEPGLNFAPWPFVTYQVVPVTGERVTEIGTGQDAMDTGLMLTRDQNIVDMEYQVVWNVSDPEKYLFNLADPEGTIRAVAESAMRDIVARSELSPILNRDRGTIATDAAQQIQQTLDIYQSGISVLRVNLDRADPPQDVIDSFRDVQAAQQERDRLTKEADAYANRVLAEARGQLAALVEQAEAYRAEAVNTAQGEAARFNSIYEEYAKAPDVTRKRMYLETMERVLGRVDKVILDQGGEAGGQGVVPYLPLDQLRRSGSGAAAAQPAPNLTGRPTATVPGAATGVPGTTNSAPGATTSNITGGGN